MPDRWLETLNGMRMLQGQPKGAGLVLRYQVDGSQSSCPAGLPPSVSAHRDHLDFCSYLGSKQLMVDVWDGESLLQVRPESLGGRGMGLLVPRVDGPGCLQTATLLNLLYIAVVISLFPYCSLNKNAFARKAQKHHGLHSTGYVLVGLSLMWQGTAVRFWVRYPPVGVAVILVMRA